MLIGLDLPEITANLNDVSIGTAIGYGVLITAVLIVVRILSAYGAVVFTLIARNFITVADRRSPGVKGPFILGWAGMRGVVSLAAALSIPVYYNDVLLPQRNLILFITFVVILLTLVLQGLTLPYLIRKMNLVDQDNHLPEGEAYLQLYKRLAEQSLVHLKENYAEELRQQQVLQQLARKWEDSHQLLENEIMATECRVVYVSMLNKQREWLRDWNKDYTIDEEVIRKHLHRLDLEEEKMKFLATE
ncbi:hypothetical protein HMPREF0765_1628 [Sphingobacterium spiritivorum ATCC 33300]|uniref:Cation/H+ exchanger transmembrane domain-containing protein n=2 Tax=Sphingobacterium spiritivorum TaxID=258 RepID=C2FWC2_SPHSI|nr:cation:proton antiporter [Sphingobacterium spiritivorum]EEI92777.1 hypothetical protein HMPREF0765_1628 [Sphingobacterium spiritivorum ATCC 33300]